jgi:hypothetical protein|tara:strand:+ start:402 stop:821 length:420 start_codon:yes stop_codon:yes gene_type:complete
MTELQDQLSTLAADLAAKLGVSRLEVTVLALEYVDKGTKDWPLLMGSFSPSVPQPEGLDTSDYPSSATVLKVAMQMGDYGFSLDHLIDAVGPDMIIRPKAYKNQLSRLLQSHGFFQKQVRQEGKRPLLWFHPERCGISN